ncbi:methionyl-tRNA formyltransferase [Pusillimonas sp. NJUB218]|uniref:methionyl-tRNA formyltransferase n=1 Tax=Pusillimonas sp. NJUB218 TaxID=2023230 RepID=UPI000F4C7F13|nr:methionyl-tRNA formyltransferase [Pusillimonas sp. NJUB218]
MNDSALLDVVRSWRPDAFLVVGWYHMVPKSWRDLAPAYGLHASLLPDYSGGAPLVWAIINGEKKTGITLFQMDDGVDSGPIVAQAEEPIFEDDTIAALYERIESRGLDLLRSALPELALGTAVLRPQSQEGRRVMPQRGPEDGVIDWLNKACYLERFVRAQTRPYPGAFFLHLHARVYVWKARAVEYDSTLPPGSPLLIGSDVGVVCGQGVLLLEEAEIGEQRLRGESLYQWLCVDSQGRCKEGQ